MTPFADLDRAPAFREHIFGALLAVYLLSGKWSPSRVLDLDPTILVEPRVWCVFGLVCTTWFPRAEGPRYRPAARGSMLAVLLTLGFFAYMMLSAAWSLDPVLARAVQFDLFLIAIVTLSLTRIVTSDEVNLREIQRAFESTLLALLFLLAFASLASAMTSRRLATLGGGPNVFGRNMGMLAILALARGMSGRGAVWGAGTAIALGLVVLSGSRGALIATGLGLTAMVFLGPEAPTRRAASACLAIVTGVAVLLYTEVGARALTSVQTRVVDLLFEHHYVSGREDIAAIVMELAPQRVAFGHGLGTFAAVSGWPYTHNMFVDARIEGGWLGLFLLMATWLAWGTSRLIRAAPRVDRYSSILIAFFVASQVSGGFYDTRALYLFVLLGPAYRLRTARFELLGKVNRA